MCVCVCERERERERMCGCVLKRESRKVHLRLLTKLVVGFYVNKNGYRKEMAMQELVGGLKFPPA